MYLGTCNRSVLEDFVDLVFIFWEETHKVPFETVVHEVVDFDFRSCFFDNYFLAYTSTVDIQTFIDFHINYTFVDTFHIDYADASESVVFVSCIETLDSLFLYFCPSRYVEEEDNHGKVVHEDGGHYNFKI